jgi:hypothetical protein
LVATSAGLGWFKLHDNERRPPRASVGRLRPMMMMTMVSRWMMRGGGPSDRLEILAFFQLLLRARFINLWIGYKEANLSTDLDSQTALSNPKHRVWRTIVRHLLVLSWLGFLAVCVCAWYRAANLDLLLTSELSGWHSVVSYPRLKSLNPRLGGVRVCVDWPAMPSQTRGRRSSGGGNFETEAAVNILF